MPLIDDLENSFASAERRKGRELESKGQVILSSASDSEVQAFVKGSRSGRVRLYADDITSSEFFAKCSCSGASGRCRHIWAVVLKLSTQGADFLIHRRELRSPPQAAEPAAQVAAKANVSSEYKERLNEQLKLRRKAHYKAQKLKKQSVRNQAKGGSAQPHTKLYPEAVQAALVYFEVNGFKLDPPELTQLLLAKRQLSRVFHPDRGGTHEEALQLSECFNIVRDYLS